MLSGATGAGLTLLGGLVLTTAGVTVLAIGATALVIVPGLWILRHGAAATATDHDRTIFGELADPVASATAGP